MTSMTKKGRPEPRVLSVPWRPNDSCPCGVPDKRWGTCCRHIDGAPLVRVPEVKTPGRPTDYSNPRCYLSFTRDCGEKISKEHYVSESILSQFGDEVLVSGFPWEPSGYSKVRGVGTLTSPVLCERHNNALAPLDTYAGLAFKAISSAVGHATKDSISERTHVFVASGDALERWAIKTLLGLIASGTASAEGKAMGHDYEVDAAGMAPVLFGHTTFAAPLGLYVSKRVGEVVGDRVRFAPLYSPELKRASGLKIYMRGVEFDVLLDVRGADPSELANSPDYRPGIVDFAGPERTGRLIVSWSTYRLKGRRFEIAMMRELNPNFGQ